MNILTPGFLMFWGGILGMILIILISGILLKKANKARAKESKQENITNIDTSNSYNITHLSDTELFDDNIPDLKSDKIIDTELLESNKELVEDTEIITSKEKLCDETDSTTQDNTQILDNSIQDETEKLICKETPKDDTELFES